MVNKTESEDGEEGGSSTSSFMLIMGTLIAIVFVYFIIQYILSYFKISRPSLPFNDVNPLF